MPKKKRSEQIAQLSVPLLVRSEGDERKYLVYKDENNYVEVEASIAMEAKEVSGIEKPFKIQFKGTNMKNVFNPDELHTDGKGEFPIPNVKKNYMADYL